MANISLLIKQNKFSQMQNFDVQHNVACKHIDRVANVFSFVTTGRHVVLCFQRFVQHLDQMLEKAVNTLRNIFHPFLYNFVEHFKRFYNETNNITNALKTIINALQCIVNAFKMHCQPFKMHYNAVFVKPGFPK